MIHILELLKQIAEKAADGSNELYEDKLFEDINARAVYMNEKDRRMFLDAAAKHYGYTDF